MLKALSKKSYNSTPIYLPGTQLADLDFEEDLLPVGPYLLGVLLGDGGLTHYTPTITTADAEVLNNCEQELPGSVKIVSCNSNRSGRAESYRLSSGKGRPNPLITGLKELGLWGQHSHNKFVPNMYKYASAKTRLAVLQGLMDTDGSASDGAYFSSSSKQLRDDVVFLARSLGLKVSTGNTENGVTPVVSSMPAGRPIVANYKCYRCYIKQTDDLPLFRVERKLAKPYSSKASRRRLISIELTRETECQCIMVSASSHLYVTNDFIPTHNTRFPETFKFVAISWPRYVGSTIQRLTKEAKKDIQESDRSSRFYASGPFATWQVRPDRFRSQFEPQYKKDPRTAAAKYECNPSFSINPYFRNEIAVRDCMVIRDIAPIEVSYECSNNVWKPVYEFAEDFYPVKGAVYSMHADLAVNGDRAGVAMSHVVRKDAVDKDIFEEDGTLHRVTDYLPYVKVDFIIAYEADSTQDPAREIQIRWARDLWYKLKNMGFNIRQFSYDGYQSTESRQELTSLGVPAPLISTDRSEEPWKNLRDMLYMGRISIPYSELLMKEIMGLTKKYNGKVDHQSGASKDVADALACSVVGALELGGQEDPGGARAYYTVPEFIVVDGPVDIMGDATLEHLQWGVQTVDTYSHNPEFFDFLGVME